jgi:hypothetical protein
VFKKGERSECCDYRGVSLLIVYKILAAAINNKLAQHAKDLGGEYQNGFRNN